MSALKLHLGCGAVHLAGWVNVDRAPGPGVDRQLDVLEGLPFEDAQLVFAEHFLEHFTHDQGLFLLRECRRVLRDDGVLRLSTPNLDWVWATAYPSRWRANEDAKSATIDPAHWRHDLEAALDCVEINHAFRAWGHRFLYNQALLTRSLRMAGFADVRRCSYGESAHPKLRGLERHELDPAAADVSSVLVLEARGRGEAADDGKLGARLKELQRDLGVS